MATLLAAADWLPANPYVDPDKVEFALSLGLGSDGRVADTGPLPARLQSMFAPRLQRLSVRTRELLLLAALEGSGHLDVLLTAGAGRFGESEVAALVQQGLIMLDMGSQTLRLAHPLIGSTVVGLATPRELRSANRMLGLAGKGIENRARHLAAAAIGPDETTALLLERSARELVLRGDAVGAVRMLLRAAGAEPAAQRSRSSSRPGSVPGRRPYGGPAPRGWAAR